jgi:histone H3/H4
MHWKNVFPDYAVKQAFYENNVERSDEHIISVMQSDLISRCLLSILKPAFILCVNNKRKFINERDIDVGKSLCIFPFQRKPVDAGHLLNAGEFGYVVKEHVDLLKQQITKQCPEIQFEKEYKMSSDTLNKLQDEVESCIRGFVQELGSNVSFKHFEITMAKILGDDSYVYDNQGYIPV